MKIEERLERLGFKADETLPPSPLLRAVHTGNYVYVSGHGPRRADGTTMTGRVGATLTLEQGYEAARLCAVGCLRSTREVLGDLDRVKRVIKVLGMVMCAEGFRDLSKVVNGCSDLLIELYGEAGRHTRSAVGMMQLPNDMAVEVEMVLEVE
jgi:enamine deaminase RidA (YjgF/YER057c/UK114 family)